MSLVTLDAAPVAPPENHPIHDVALALHFEKLSFQYVYDTILREWSLAIGSLENDGRDTLIHVFAPSVKHVAGEDSFPWVVDSPAPDPLPNGALPDSRFHRWIQNVREWNEWIETLVLQ